MLKQNSSEETGTSGELSGPDPYGEVQDSDPDEVENSSVGSNVSITGVGGTMIYCVLIGDNRCRVLQQRKIGGHKVACGHMAASCPKSNHLNIQRAPAKRAPAGTYDGITGEGTLDVFLLSTVVSPASRLAQQKANTEAAMSRASSQQKGQAEQRSANRSSQVTFGANSTQNLGTKAGTPLARSCLSLRR
jgi:hypothetical protein